MLVTERGIVIAVSAESPSKAFPPINSSELPKVIVLRFLAFLNIADSMRITEFGSVKLAWVLLIGNENNRVLALLRRAPSETT